MSTRLAAPVVLRAPAEQAGGGLRLRLRLAAYFAVIAVVPLGLASWLLVRSAEEGARNRLDTRLAVAAEGGRAALAGVLAETQARAVQTAASPDLQRALVAGSRPRLRAIAAREHVVIRLAGVTVAGKVPPGSVTRAVSVTVGGKRLGTVVASLPLDQALLRRLLPGTALPAGATGLLVQGGRVLAAGKPGLVGAPLRVDGERALLRGRPYRARVLPLVATKPPVVLAAVAPAALVERQTEDFRRRLALADGATLVAVALLAYLLAHPVGRGVRELLQSARLAHRDQLTELPNRRSFEETLTRELRRLGRGAGPVSLLVADLDRFKRLNDTWGHQTGDEALRLFARVLAGSVRDVDLPARVGGEEFAVVMPETGAAGARELAERLRAELAARPLELPGGGTLALTASWGAATATTGTTLEALYAAADAALYEAKRGGRDRVVHADEEHR